GECYPYNHDIRIQDMGKIFSTTDENESIQIIRKYINLTNEQCKEAKRRFPQMPDDACKPVTEVYLIASSDLIGKYFWMNCFATFDWKLWNESDGKKWDCDKRNFYTLPLTNVISKDGRSFSSNQIARIIPFGNSLIAQVVFGNSIGFIEVKELKYTDAISLIFKNNVTEVFILKQDEGGRVRKYLVEDVYILGIANYTFSNVREKVLQWAVYLDPSYSYLILADEKLKNSVFTKLFFFDGAGLKNFQLVLKNPEIRLYKVLL
ncbi:MAG: hypothetical protein RMJ17_04245, partial [Candidatus Aenigmarchaeota archaeon]|nr:hypothetical protein [Candidatus Aenigmarchaeota archaeon]MDW8149768.1 hypothetical protein [Candidatus Aenigmarchaeota archaeon]